MKKNAFTGFGCTLHSTPISVLSALSDLHSQRSEDVEAAARRRLCTHAAHPN